jgi:hypothetical protein
VTRRTVEDQYPEWFRPRPTIKFCPLAVHGPRGICGTAVALPRLPQRKPKSRMEELKAAHRIDKLMRARGHRYGLQGLIS